jgi:hypothetical protein
VIRAVDQWLLNLLRVGWSTYPPGETVAEEKLRLSAGTRTKAVTQLVTVLLSHAPDAPAAGQAEQIIRRAEADGLEGTDLELILAGMLYSGLAYGNWPWSQFGR